jgi:predicted dehydrogenase
MTKVSFAIVGSGWRAEFYLRVARACPEHFEVIGVSARNAQKRERLEKEWGVKTFSSVADLAGNTRPMFVVTWGKGQPVICSTINHLIRESRSRKNKRLKN